MLNVDYTLLVQIPIFIILWMLLKRFWFDPALRIIRERTARSEGAIAEARAIQADAERLRAEHAAALDQARAEAAREVQEILHFTRGLGTSLVESRRMLRSQSFGIGLNGTRLCDRALGTGGALADDTERRIEPEPLQEHPED